MRCKLNLIPNMGSQEMSASIAGSENTSAIIYLYLYLYIYIYISGDEGEHRRKRERMSDFPDGHSLDFSIEFHAGAPSEWVSMCVCVCVYVFLYACTHTHTNTHTHTHTHTHKHTHMHIYRSPRTRRLGRARGGDTNMKVR
jgi:hypothetical protein